MSNSSIEEILRMPILDVFPQIFDKEIVFVPPSTQVWHAMLFLVPLRKIYANGIVVVKDNKPVGTIDSHHIFDIIIKSGLEKLECITCEQIMTKITQPLMDRSMLEDVLNTFSENEFGFCPVTKNNIHISAISTRDFLPIISKMNIAVPFSNIASRLIHASENITVKNAISIMLEKNIRKIAIVEDHYMTVIDDRSVLEFLCFSKKPKQEKLETEIQHLAKTSVLELDEKTSISDTATLLYEKDMPCGISGHVIITPWDLVTKVLGQYVIKTNVDKMTLPD